MWSILFGLISRGLEQLLKASTHCFFLGHKVTVNPWQGFRHVCLRCGRHLSIGNIGERRPTNGTDKNLFYRIKHLKKCKTSWKDFS